VHCMCAASQQNYWFFDRPREIIGTKATALVLRINHNTHAVFR
jgi:hypothetical protein